MWNLIQNDVVLCYFQTGVEQSIIQCKKQSSLISSIALKRNKEKLGEKINLVSSHLLNLKVVVVVLGLGGGGETLNRIDLGDVKTANSSLIVS